MPLAIGEGSVLLFVVGASYVGRIAVGGVADPLDSAFNMEVLNAKEHATNTGLEIAAGGIMAAIAIVIGSRLIGLRRFHNAIPHHGNGASGVHGHLLVRVPASRTRQDRTLRTIPRRFRSRSHGRLSRALRATTRPSPRPNSHSRAPQPALKARAEPQHWYDYRNTQPGSYALKVTVRLFASYREKAGTSEIEMTLPQEATVGVAASMVAERYPGITQRPDSLVVAVNQEYADHLHILREGDEVALIPPVSGGQL